MKALFKISMLAIVAVAAMSMSAPASTTAHQVTITAGVPSSNYLPQTARLVSAENVKGGTVLHLALYCPTNDKDSMIDVQLVVGGEKYIDAKGDLIVWYTSEKTGNVIRPGVPALIQAAKPGLYAGRCD